MYIYYEIVHKAQQENKPTNKLYH